MRESNGKLLGLGGVIVRGIVDDGFGEHERAILSFLIFFILKVCGAKVDAGTTLQRREEGRGHACTDPARHPVELLARHHACRSGSGGVLHRRRRGINETLEVKRGRLENGLKKRARTVLALVSVSVSVSLTTNGGWVVVFNWISSWYFGHFQFDDVFGR